MRGPWMAMFAVGVGVVARGADWPQWRGPERTGLAPERLAAQWPAEGPRQLWKITTTGAGYAAPAIAANRVYVTATEPAGETHRGWVHALRASDGSSVWSREYGPEWRQNYDQARSTPTVVGNRLYVVSGLGRVVCLAVEDGATVWSVDTFERFGGGNITWGIAESPLVDEGRVICHPGGKDAAVAALDAATGATVWTSKGLSDKSAYCSPMTTTLCGVKQIVTQTADHVVGLEATTGRVLWTAPHRNRYAVHPNTPLTLAGDRVVVASGYGYGAELYQIARAADGTFSANRTWTVKDMDSHIQGMLLHDGAIYGAGSGGGLCRIDPDTGSVTYRMGEIQRASLVLAPPYLVAYAERGGSVFLVEPGPTSYAIKGRFKVDFGEGPHWAHPSLASGVLYIRHGKELAAYKVGAE